MIWYDNFELYWWNGWMEYTYQGWMFLNSFRFFSTFINGFYYYHRSIPCHWKQEKTPKLYSCNTNFLVSWIHLLPSNPPLSPLFLSAKHAVRTLPIIVNMDIQPLRAIIPRDHRSRAYNAMYFWQFRALDLQYTRHLWVSTPEMRCEATNEREWVDNELDSVELTKSEEEVAVASLSSTIFLPTSLRSHSVGDGARNGSDMME